MLEVVEFVGEVGRGGRPGNRKEEISKECSEREYQDTLLSLGQSEENRVLQEGYWDVEVKEVYLGKVIEEKMGEKEMTRLE